MDECLSAYESVDRFFDLSIDLLSVASTDGFFKRINPAFSTTLGYTTDELLARPFLDFVHPDDIQATIEAVERLASGGVVIDFDNRYRCKDGSYRWISWRASAVSDEGPIYAVGRDVTSREHARRELLEKEAQLRAVVESSLDYIMLLDPEGTILFINRTVPDLTVGQVTGTSVFEYLPADGKEEAAACFQRVLSSGRPDQYTTQYRTQTGESLHFESRVGPVVRDTEVVALALIATDVTWRENLVQEIRHLNTQLEGRVVERTRELEQVNQQLEAFTYSVSHDLRAPLRAIDGFSRILAEELGGQIGPNAARYLQLVGTNVTQMNQLIDDLLSFARLGRRAITKQTVRPTEIVSEVLADLDPLMQGRTVATTVGDLPECQADASLLKQVFMNLLSNALKFTTGQDKANIECGAEISEGVVAYFVRDDGIGFDMRYADKLFRPFQRLVTIDEYEGTGIGLAVVDRIVARHGGRVWAESSPGAGSTFYFTLGEVSSEPESSERVGVTG